MNMEEALASDLRAPADKIVGPAAQLIDGLAGCAKERGLRRHEASHCNEEVPSRRPLDVMYRTFLHACHTDKVSCPADVLSPQ